MSEVNVLYGSHASYYTAKNRAYLRKKGIPFVERLPSHGRFRNHIRPTSGSHRIPQLETADGEILQDSTTILDALESRYPAIPAFPATPKQRLVAHLMELFGSEGLVLLAWRFRWFCEDNLHFVKMDFGRSFKPQGTDDELLHYGQIIADRMLSRGNLSQPPEVIAEMERSFTELLKRLEVHLMTYPFMLGGHPSVADYSLMGALHAHMGRDPVPLHFMQRNAPRVFRWVEHMMAPEIQSPEFPDYPIEYEANDSVPATFLSVLEYLFDEHLERFVQDALAWNSHVEAGYAATGSPVSEEDQPRLARQTIEWRGALIEVDSTVQNVWLLQRALGFYASLDADQAAACLSMLGSIGGEALLEVTIQQPPLRRENRFYFG